MTQAPFNMTSIDACGLLPSLEDIRDHMARGTGHAPMLLDNLISYVRDLMLPFEHIPHASDVEKRIVGKLVDDLLRANNTLSVWDGEQMTVVEENDPVVIFKALASTDMDTLYVHSAGRSGRPRFITLVWGNDADVIFDYNTSLEEVIAEANKLAEALR